MNVQGTQRCGIPCPEAECDEFIPMTIEQLLGQGSFRCRCQKIELTVNRQESVKAMSLLQDVKAAQDGVRAAERGYD